MASIRCIAIDFVELPATQFRGEKYDYLMVIVDRLTGYVLALPCRKKGLTAEKAAELFLEPCVFLMGLPKDITADNAGIINGKFWDTLFTLSGVEQCKTEIYRPSSNGRAERAVQTVTNTLRNFLEQSGREGSTWPQLLPQALWGLNDLPGVISGFSPHRLLFGREPVGFGDVAPLVDEFDGAEDAEQFFDRLVEERAHVQSKLTALHKKEEAQFLKKHPPQRFQPGDWVWVRNVDDKSTAAKIKRIWQGPFEVMEVVSDGVYKISYLNDVLTVLSSARLKPYLAKHTGERIPLCSKTDVDFLVEDDQWVVERITGHQEFGRGRNKVMKWRVKYKGHAEEQWEPARSFVHHLTDEWVKYNKRHKVNVSLAEVKALSLTAGIRHMSSPPPSTGSHDMRRAVRLCYSLLAWDMGMSIEDMPL